TLAPQERQEALRLTLLTESTELTVTALAAQLAVSRTTILRDLQQVTEWFATYELNLERRQGRLSLTGPEANRRRALVALLVDRLQPDKLAGLVRGTEPAPHSAWPQLSAIIHKAEARLEKRFTDE